MNDPVQLITNKPDKELAAEHKAKIIEASEPLMAALSNARHDGFIAQLNFGEDAFQRIMITGFSLFKSF